MDKTYIDIDSIRSVAYNLNQKREALIEYYKKTILPHISKTCEYMDESYVVYYQTIASLKQEFQKIFNTIESLSNILSKNVVNDYSEDMGYIKHLFNEDLNNKMLDLLNGNTDNTDDTEFLDL